MQDTVDQAHGAVPRTLADIIEDTRRAGRVRPTLRRQPKHGRARSPAPARMGCTWRCSPGSPPGA